MGGRPIGSRAGIVWRCSRLVPVPGRPAYTRSRIVSVLCAVAYGARRPVADSTRRHSRMAATVSGRSSDRIGGLSPNLLPISVKTPCADSGRNARRGSLPRAGAALHVRIGQAGLRPILAGTSWPPTPGFFRITTSDV
jgi:hypothetical protein